MEVENKEVEETIDSMPILNVPATTESDVTKAVQAVQEESKEVAEAKILDPIKKLESESVEFVEKMYAATDFTHGAEKDLIMELVSRKSNLETDELLTAISYLSTMNVDRMSKAGGLAAGMISQRTEVTTAALKAKAEASKDANGNGPTINIQTGEIERLNADADKNILHSMNKLYFALNEIQDKLDQQKAEEPEEEEKGEE